MRLVAWTTAGALLAAAIAAAGCAKPDEPPTPVAQFDSSDSAEPDAVAGSDFLDPNFATAAALAALPGMSDSVTLALIAGRPYTSMTALDKVLARHLTEQQRDSVYARLWLPLDLNTASSDEILLIPGVDGRERQVLEEYRPYMGIEKYRRDIGQKLGPEDAARIERFVKLP